MNREFTPSVPEAQIPVSTEVPEKAIAARLRDILASTGWFTDIEVGVRQGVVTIDGISDSPEHRSWATELANSLEGTIATVNRLELGVDFASTFDRATSEGERLYRRVGQALPLVVLATGIATAAWFVSALVARMARRALRNRIPSPLLRGVVVRVISIPVLLLGIYFVLQVAGLTRLAVTLLGGTGLVGIIVGFAFRDIAENFLASLLLSVRNPFSTGDLINVAGETGVVENLNTRSTVLLTLDGNHVQIPNATVFKSTIRNYSSTPTRRAEFLVGIGYDSSVAHAQMLISGILRQHPAVLNRPEPLVLVDELGAATVNLRVQYWFDSRTYSPAKTNSALLRQTKNALLDAGIELPDPAREVVFPKGVPLVQTPDPATQVTSTGEKVRRERDAVEMQESTEGEGDLFNDTDEVRDLAVGAAPEAENNLLKR
ncbi:mechanosensitive ion channel family protein [uncultured Devosia sp.]|uniref:mechanosensitive ion channel family protein n=1 Tax=uncultured Devosia sp. TaxID=211434 RepID=UPI002617C4BC|nr:mechanosensitive ion channel family protein [uncultured Devosia sp.]